MSAPIENTDLSPPLEDARARLLQHFSHSTEKHPALWDDLWIKGTFLPWDKGIPNPALIDILVQKVNLIGASSAENRKKALVPGCGRGYDALVLASFGYDAVGLEYSATAVAAAKAEHEKSEAQNSYPVVNEQVGKGKVEFVQGDFFDEQWVKEVGAEGGFDLIYDYTVGVPQHLLQYITKHTGFFFFLVSMLVALTIYGGSTVPLSSFA